MLAFCFTQIRFRVHGRSEHLEEANTRIRAHWQLDGISLEDLARPLITGQLSTLRGLRFNGTDPDHMLFSNLKSGKRLTFRDLAAFLPELEPGKSLPVTTFITVPIALDFILI